MDINTTIKNLDLKKITNILEIGPGNKPTGKYIDLDNCIYETVDINPLLPISNTHTHFSKYFHEFETNNKYDLIIDRCCLHEQPPNSRKKYLNKINLLLNLGGQYICEHAIKHNQLFFIEDNLLFDPDSNCLLAQENNNVSICKYIPSALEIEEELKSIGFKIKTFYCHREKKIICNRNDPVPRYHDPDLLFFMAQKH